MSGGVTVPSVTDLTANQSPSGNYRTHVDWIPIPHGTMGLLPVYVHLFYSTDITPTQTRTFFHRHGDMLSTEFSMVLGDMGIPMEVQQTFVGEISMYLSLADATYKGYINVIITCDAITPLFDLNSVPVDDSLDYMNVNDLVLVNELLQDQDQNQTTNSLGRQPRYPYSNSFFDPLEALLLAESDGYEDMDEAYVNGSINDEVDWFTFESMETYVGMTIPASKSAIKNLEKVILEATAEGACAVCMEEFKAGVEATWLPCLHFYHGYCIARWLEINHQCPLCRFPMPHD